MTTDLSGLREFLLVARCGGFRDAARQSNGSASGLSEAVRRLEARLGVRLLNRTTRTVAPTEAGEALLARLHPALREVDAALGVLDTFRDRVTGRLRLNVPVVAARLVLPDLLPAFLHRYPDVEVEVVAEDGFVDLLAIGCDAGIRYDERLEADMIALPIGARRQRYATAASPDYLRRHGSPTHPRDLLAHRCVSGRFASGALTTPWEFERNGEVLRVSPPARLVVRVGGATDLGVAAAVAGIGVIHLFEEWLRPELDRFALLPVLPDWWQWFSGPFLYYPGRRLLPGPLRAFVDFVRERGEPGS